MYINFLHSPNPNNLAQADHLKTSLFIKTIDTAQLIMKRTTEETDRHPSKKHKQDHSYLDHPNSTRPNGNEARQHHNFKGDGVYRYNGNSGKRGAISKDRDSSNPNKAPVKPRQHQSHAEAFAQLPPATSKSCDVPPYMHFTIPTGLPDLPPVKEGNLSTAPFIHKSTQDRTRSTEDLSYERLEFLGDAYIELIASRLIFERFYNLTAGQQSQLRELLVKNETLAEYSRAYGFEERIESQSIGAMRENGEKWAEKKGKANKGFSKVLGDVFEAYVAAVILSHGQDGFAVAEKWLTQLWATKLVEAAKDFKGSAYNPRLILEHGNGANPLEIYDPTAKMELQRRIMGGKDTKLEYLPYRNQIELKGDQLGQNKHFIAVYLTGYGYEKKLLGQGEGKNKVEAGNWAATQAMHGESKKLVDDCAEKLKITREERKAKLAAEAAANGSES